MKYPYPPPPPENNPSENSLQMTFVACLATKSIIACDQNMEAYSGFSLKEMKAMGAEFFKDWIHPLDYPRCLNICDFVLAGFEKLKNKARIRSTKKKEWYWSEAEIRIKERDKKGNPKKIIAYISIGEKADMETAPIKGAYHQYFTPKLTDCEQELLPYLAAGTADKRIAADLDKSQKTVRTQVKSIMRKLNLHKRIKLVAFLKRIEY